MNILLVEPDFPIPSKSKNHKNFLPIGLLKIACYHESLGDNVVIVRGNLSKKELRSKLPFSRPSWIGVTSLFTYWSEQVRDSVEHYRSIFPKTKIRVGGIYASLMPNHCKKYTKCDEVVKGVIERVEEYAKNSKLDYNLLSNLHPIDYQIIHASRGCFRKCKFCGTWKIEPEVKNKNSIKKEIYSNKLIFYDNNLLTNQHIEEILEEISEFRHNGKKISCESQSGIDGRILIENPHLATLLKKANFKNIRIAWDWDYSQHKEIKKQLDILNKVGFKNKDLFVFMLYNWKVPFKEMEKKRIKCWKWKVQIADCRYRPLHQIYDNYNPRKSQTNEDYYIHPRWSDAKVKQFRRNVRRQNICVRMGFPFYSRALEQKKLKNGRKLKNMVKNNNQVLPNLWVPHRTYYSKKYNNI